MIGIVISAHGQPYRGAELRTRESFQYGRFEASIKSAQGPGILNSFFTYNDSVPTTLWAEIDFEILGRYSDNVDVNVINVDGSHLRQHPLDFNPHLDFHTYSIEWTPNYVAWFMDGEEFYRQTGTHIDALFQSGKLMMNSWTPIYEDWVGIMDDRILPRFSYYDWVSYAAYTPGTGSVGNDQNFTPVWLDDFDEYDPIRWEKSDGWSWNGNNALLVAENVVFEEGQMILCLTRPGEEGRVDIHPP
ncbi:MAG: family 16 glycosylhydrolase, partial [Candidatus Marinimicrobia bacterium]|nr:family 16 glycosylhydrolase [Candidatus Neomarinimicrobiota bacterium]